MQDAGETNSRRETGSTPQGTVAVVGAGLTGGKLGRPLRSRRGSRCGCTTWTPARLAAAVERAAAAAGFLAGSGLADCRPRSAALNCSQGPRARGGGLGVRARPGVRARGPRARSARMFAVDRRRRARRRADLLELVGALHQRHPDGGGARPERCLAAHPYNPPHLVPLVELAPGALTRRRRWTAPQPSTGRPWAKSRSDAPP